MTTDIFIRTYENDLDWLKYCLMSIQKYVVGYRQVIICIPENQRHLLDNWNLTAEKVVTCPIYKEDYLGQQVSKVLSYKYTDADSIVFIDSDSIFTKPTNLIDEMFENGKPIIYKTVYEHVGDAICWKEITEKAIGEPLKYEYMRRLPCVYLRSTLINAGNHILVTKGINIDEYIISQPERDYSEFNYLGAYSDIFENGQYRIKDTEIEGHGNDFFNQYWSWGGIEIVKNEIEKILE